MTTAQKQQNGRGRALEVDNLRSTHCRAHSQRKGNAATGIEMRTQTKTSRHQASVWQILVLHPKQQCRLSATSGEEDCLERELPLLSAHAENYP